ncbi:methyltransferase domain-containing protein [Piscinibacter defluvii]|uniref:methyltransferase domain-containing protein n=1 Tax=Piscinibacter defluvii TaxID=1796922 RepID=UPI000FDD8BAB|nr:methyltransferase domain-containing protein [Piscinibacter defluvii]
MSDSVEYYRQFAAEFFRTTVAVDMAAIRQRFLAYIPAGARILDAGCGSGRDAKAFAALGFSVTAFDATPELASLATEHCGFEVGVRRFEDVDETAAYDGIWCCASLLHVPLSEMQDALSRLWAALAPGGTLYLSLKHGRGERLHNGRRFTDADEETIRTWFRPFAEVLGIEVWLTRDQRPERDEAWTNALVMKAPPSGRRLVTGEADHFLPHLSAAIASATEVDLAVAFIKTTGLRLLLPDLQAVLAPEAKRRVRVLTSDYLDITDPEALRLLLLLREQGADVRVFVTQGSSFHLKAYIFAVHRARRRSCRGSGPARDGYAGLSAHRARHA